MEKQAFSLRVEEKKFTAPAKNEQAKFIVSEGRRIERVREAGGEKERPLM